MHNFRKLSIWIEAMKLAKETYLAVGLFPKEEVYGLVSQIKRCAISVPSNIAEGSSRTSNKEFVRFFKISMGSLFELETQLILSNQFQFISYEVFENLRQRIVSLQKMIKRFIEKLCQESEIGQINC